MGINFPSTPAEGQVINVAPGKSFVFRNGLWRKAPMTTALPKNYVGNPALQISQQNGAAAVGANGAYPVDQWFIHKGGGNYVSVQQVASADPLATPFAIVRTTTTGFPTPAGTDALRHKIEGLRIADLLWGTAEAKQVVLRCTAWASAAGLFAFALGNGVYDRSYVIPVNLTTTPQVFTFVIPGDTAGTWPTDTSAGMILSIVAATSSSDQTATPLQWLASGEFGVAGMASIVGDPNEGKWIAFAQVGLYADPYLTGVAPPFEVPNIVDELRRCQRHWYRAYGLRGWTIGANWVNAQFMRHPAPMRISPAAAIVGAPAYYDGAATSTAASVQANTSNFAVLELNFTLATSALTAGRVGINYWGSDANYVAVSARL